jgi:site-specific DNA-methyltransferase (adenine-specific)
VRSNESVKILKKIRKHNKKFLSDTISARLPFGIPTTYEPKESGIPCWFTQKLGLKYVDKKDYSDENNYINKYKLLIPKAPIAGQTDFSKPIMIYYEGNILIAKPGEICSESWLVAFASEDLKEVEGFKKYLLTKTFRFLLLQTLVSQNTSRKNFCFIPTFDTYKIDITDKYLKDLWELSDKDEELINRKIRNSGE